MSIIITEADNQVWRTIGEKVNMKTRTIEKYDKLDRPYCEDVAYIEGHKHTGKLLLELIEEGGIGVAHFMDFIFDKLQYNTCFFEFNSKDYISKYGGNAANLSKILAFLKSKKVCIRARELEKFANKNKDCYWLSPNVIYYGDYKVLQTELNKRKNDVYYLTKKDENNKPILWK